MSGKNSNIDCPCGSGKGYNDCCRPFIEGVRPAPTAEALMRSRYTAFALNNTRYLFETWHPSTRPARVETEPATKWIRLKIIDSHDDHVEFVATCRMQGKAYRLHEHSRFVFEGGRWFYLDGELARS